MAAVTDTEQARQAAVGRKVLAVTTAATFLAMVTFTTPLVTLASTARALGSSPGGQAWILSSMSVGLASALLVCGAIGDDYGRRTVLSAGSALLGLASVLAALAPSTVVLVLARVGQGIGGAAIVACSLGLIGHTFPTGAARARATGLWGASIGAGTAIGPLVMSWLDDTVNWRVGYLLLAVGSVVLAAAATRLAEQRTEQPRPVDLLGAVLLGFGLAAVLAGLVQGRVRWSSPLVWVLFAVGLALLGGFLLHESRTRAPMLELTLFRLREFQVSVVAGLAAGAGGIALMSFISTFLQRTLAYTAFGSAALLFAWSGSGVAASLVARRLPARVSTNARLVGSLLLAAAGQAMVAGMGADDPPIRLLPGLIVAGVGYGALNAALGQIAVTSVPAGKTSVGSGANNTARYVGAAIGVTVVAVLAAHDTRAAQLTGWTAAALVTAGLSVLGALLVLVLHRRPVTVPD